MSRASAVVVLIVGTFVLAACSSDPVEGDDTSTPSDAGTDADSQLDPSADAGPLFCPEDLPGPALVELAMPSGTRYCIDATEVTQAHYDEFVQADIPVESQAHPVCSAEANDTFSPLVTVEDFGCGPSAYDPANQPDAPVVCVDFCDAVAYCHWAGKRLCGVPGQENVTFGTFRDPESVSNLGPADPEVSQWYNACSAGGTREYPYGDTFDEEHCGGPEASTAEACAAHEPAGTVYGLSAGVREWENLCNDEASCPIRGGSRGEGAVESACATLATTFRQAKYDWIGFRCCVDLQSQ